MPKLSKVGFFLFILNFNYLWLRIIVFNFFYNNYGNMGVLYALLMIVIVTSILLMIPKNLFKIDFQEKYNKSVIKYFYGSIMLIETIFAICMTTYLLNKIFIYGSNFYLILIFICLGIGFLSCSKPRDIMEISTLFSIIGYTLFIISIIYFPSLDLSILLPFEYKSPAYLILFSLMIVIDNLKILISKEGIELNKKMFIFPIVIAILIFVLEYFILICNSGTIIFKNVYWVGFICLSLEQITKYIGNFDFIYIFFVVTCVIFKFSFNISLLRESFKVGKNFYMLLVVSILIVTCILSYFMLEIPKTIYIMPYIILLSSVLIIWFIKECYFARKIKK